jgi:hypothetical protein
MVRETSITCIRTVLVLELHHWSRYQCRKTELEAAARGYQITIGAPITNRASNSAQQNFRVMKYVPDARARWASKKDRSHYSGCGYNAAR